MPIPEISQTINRATMRDEVYVTLLDWIQEGVLHPGEKLSDKALADTLGVSRTPVREALRRLEDKALVEASANRWTRVAPISRKEAHRIYPIIWKLEELAVETAIDHLTQTDFTAMQNANDDMHQATCQGDATAASQADMRFHDVFIQRTGNPHLIGMIQDLKIRHRRLELFFFEASGKGGDSVNAHKQIMAALRSGAVKQACDLIRCNWQVSLHQLESRQKTNTRDKTQ